MHEQRAFSKEPGIKPINKSYDELNERQQKFIDLVATGYHKKVWARCKAGEKMTLAAAYELAGYEGKAKKQAGWRLYMQTKHIIYKRRSEMVELNLCPVMASEVLIPCTVKVETAAVISSSSMPAFAAIGAIVEKEAANSSILVLPRRTYKQWY